MRQLDADEPPSQAHSHHFSAAWLFSASVFLILKMGIMEHLLLGYREERKKLPGSIATMPKPSEYSIRSSDAMSLFEDKVHVPLRETLRKEAGASLSPVNHHT